MKPPQKGETFHDVYKRASLAVKKELDSLKKECKDYIKEILHQKLIDELDTDKKHHHLMRLCANAFADTELSSQSGYKFYFAEPLIERASEINKNSGGIFDIFLYNEEENRGIFIECKSSIGENHKAQDTLQQIERSKDFFIKKIRYFSDCLGITLDPERFEYVSCIYVEDSEKFLQSQTAQTTKAVKKFDPDLVKHWIYIPHSETIKLHHDQKHFSKKLTDLLLQGFQLENLHSRERYDLSFYLNMHPYRFLIYAVIGHCYDQNLHNEVDDPKIIKKQDIINYLHRKIPLSASDDEKKALITKKVEQIIHYGEKYDLFEILSDDSIKIKSIGVQLNVVKKHLKTKFFERWIEEKAEERCQKRALEKFEEKYYNENYRRLDYFDPSINK